MWFFSAERIVADGFFRFEPEAAPQFVRRREVG